MRVFFCFATVVFLLAGQQTPPVAAPSGAPPSSTQPPAQSSAPPIKVSVTEVMVPVTVQDENGKFVSNLEKSDFQILDQGRPQVIEYFSREVRQPVVVGFLIDLSSASRTHWKNYQDAAIELVNTLLPGDKKYSGYLIGYSGEAELMVNTTSNPEKLMDKLRKVKPGGGSALFDGIYQACTRRSLVLGEPMDPRRVLVVIGDGNDNSSNHTLDQVVELAQRNQVTIYGISTMAYGFNSDGNDNLVKLAEETGGRVEYPLMNPYKDVSGYLSTPSDEGNYAYTVGTGGYASAIASSIFKSVANVAGEITTQYILRYIPDVPTADSNRQYRKIEVKVALANVKVRAKKGYYPFAP